MKKLQSNNAQSSDQFTFELILANDYTTVVSHL